MRNVPVTYRFTRHPVCFTLRIAACVRSRICVCCMRAEQTGRSSATGRTRRGTRMANTKSWKDANGAQQRRRHQDHPGYPAEGGADHRDLPRIRGDQGKAEAPHAAGRGVHLHAPLWPWRGAAVQPPRKGAGAGMTRCYVLVLAVLIIAAFAATAASAWPATVHTEANSPTATASVC